MSNVIFEPTEDYVRTYKRLHEEKVALYFERLVQSARIDIEQNRATVAQYNACTQQVAQLTKKRNWMRFWRVLMCITILLIPLVILKITPLIRQLLAEIETADQRAEQLLAQAHRQTLPLCRLFTDRDALHLIEETLPQLDFAPCFSAEQETDMCLNYDFGRENRAEQTVLDVLAGRYNGNPFVFEKRRVHTMGTETYHGYKTISWTESYIDNEGRRKTRTRTETLHAMVEKPKPFYHVQTVLSYGAQGGPELSFSRKAGHVETLSERELERHVKRGEKKLQRRTDKAVQSGDNFTEMSNTDFEVLWGAIDRNHEVQFRTLFTPLAQTNVTELLRSTAGFGDDFAFVKRGRINHVLSEHSQGRELVLAAREYHSHSYDIIRENFLGKNAAFFRAVYFDFAPLWSIPLYQERPVHSLHPLPPMTHFYAAHESEATANTANTAYLVHPATKTPAILKATPLGAQNDADAVCITAYSYDIAQRVDVVTVYGGDGRFHAVHVPWDEYLPLEARGQFKLAACKAEMPQNVIGSRNGLCLYSCG